MECLILAVTALLSFMFPFHIWYILLIGYVTHYLCVAVKKPALVCADGKFKSFLMDNMPIIKEAFWPTFWCYNCYSQGFVPRVIWNYTMPNINYKREILQLKDGGRVALDWLDPNQGSFCQPEMPVVVILPGMTGDSRSGYIKGLVLGCSRAGHRVVVFNNRGLGGLKLKTQRTSCASCIDDIEEVLKFLRRKYPNAPIGGVGISFGGIVLGNYMAKRGNEACNYLNAAMLVSVPFNYSKAAEYSNWPICSLYSWQLTYCLKSLIRREKDVLEGGPWVLDEVLKCRSVTQYDKKFTIKQFGFENVEEYYNEASIHYKVDKFKVPTMCINASDDPIQPFNVIPFDVASNNKNLAILIPVRGSHGGFMDGILPFNNNQYLFRLCEQYFSRIFKFNVY